MSDLTSVLGRLLSWVLTVLCAAYLLRVPLLTGLGVIVLYWAALFSPAKPLLGNGLDVGTFSGLVYVSLTAVLLAWVIMVTGRLVRLHGIERFFGAASSRTDRIAPYIKWLRLLYYYALIPINLVAVIGAVAGATYTSERLGWPLALGAGALGLLLFLPFAVAVHLVELLFARPVVLRNEPSDVFLPTAGEPDDAREHDTGDEPEGQTPRPQSLRQFEQLVRGSDPASRLMRRPWVAWLVRRLRALSRLFPENVGRGYFEYRDGEVAWIRRGHMGALALFALTLVFYALLGARDFLRLTIGEPPLVPTLCYILLLATLFCWGFSGYAFFLDRYRIPVFIPLVALLLVTSYAPWLESDYYYPTTEPVQEIEGEPSSDDSMVVVATTGGGIQSAAWTARVLTGLEHKCRRECAQSFGESIRLISSVSGGSVGTMYFVNEYSGGRLPDKDAELEEIVTRTERSSLDHVVWGLLYPDLVRLFNVLPIKLGWDRGRALEQAWLREDAAWEGREGVRVGLSEWRNDARVGDRPAVIFNTTIAENGRRLALTTTEPLAGRLRHDELLPRGEPATDISVVTATRLSASFPYVSPAARADVEGLPPT